MRLKLAIIVMVVATACSGAAAPAPAQSTQADIDLSGQPIGLTLWHTQTGANAKALGDLVDKFNKEHPKIQVKYVLQPWDSIAKKRWPISQPNKCKACGRPPANTI